MSVYGELGSSCPPHPLSSGKNYEKIVPDLFYAEFNKEQFVLFLFSISLIILEISEEKKLFLKEKTDFSRGKCSMGITEGF